MLVMPKLLARAKEKQAPPTTRFTVMATRHKNTLPVPTHVQALIDALETLRPAYWTACHAGLIQSLSMGLVVADAAPSPAAP
jgi:hypothetical protein